MNVFTILTINDEERHPTCWIFTVGLYAIAVYAVVRLLHVGVVPKRLNVG